MNPKLNEFLKNHKDITLIGIGWACFWRAYLTIMAICFAFGLFVALLSA